MNSTWMLKNLESLVNCEDVDFMVKDTKLESEEGYRHYGWRLLSGSMKSQSCYQLRKEYSYSSTNQKNIHIVPTCVEVVVKRTSSLDRISL